MSEFRDYFWNLPYALYQPFLHQLFQLLRCCNCIRENMGLAPVPIEANWLKRAVVRPFDEAEQPQARLIFPKASDIPRCERGIAWGAR